MKSLTRIINEAEKSKKQNEYQEFFDKKLEKYGVDSPAKLSDEEKKKFFDEVDAEWKGEGEKVEEKRVEEDYDEEEDEDSKKMKENKEKDDSKKKEETDEDDEDEDEDEDDEDEVNEAVDFTSEAKKIATKLLKDKKPSVAFTQLLFDVLEQIYWTEGDNVLPMEMADAGVEKLKKVSQEMEQM